MAAYRRPGAYIERVDRAQPGPVSLRTDIAAFIGIAREGPLDTPVPVESFRQFQSHFGDFTGAGYMAYCVKAFFENGGARCWVIRVASRFDGFGAQAAVADVAAQGGGWRLSAATPGSWGNTLTVRLRRERRAETRLDPGAGSDRFVVADRVSGIGRGELVELRQPGLPPQIAIAGRTDPATGAVHWDSGRPGWPYPAQRIALDPARPATLASVGYALDISRQGRLIAHVPGLSQVPEHDRYGPDVLAGADYATAIRHGGIVEAALPVLVTDLRTDLQTIPQPLDVPPEGLRLGQGRDGLTRLTAADFTGEAFDPQDDDDSAARKLRGIRALELVEEISVVAAPDIVIRPDPDPVYVPEPLPEPDPCQPCPPPPEPRRDVRAPSGQVELPPVFSYADIFQVQTALIAHCEDRGDRFAVLDPPFGTAADDAAGISAIMAWRTRFDTTYAALYYSWLHAFEPRRAGTTRQIPPSGHVLGKYAFHDLRTGVHRAPANTRLVWLHDLVRRTSFGEQELLNDLGVNVIRSEAARGLRIMGARTLSSDPDWRFVNVRRLVLLIKRAVYLLSQWVVFEPNNAATRRKYAAVLANFLQGLWVRGAFAGASAEASYFVKCDEENNTAADRDAGRLLAEIGVAPAAPLEFIVLRVGRQGNQLTVAEPATLARAA